MPPSRKKKQPKRFYTFNFTEDPNNNWSCHLHCGQCEQKKKDGKRCKKRVCFGTPLCWIHNKIKYGVQIADSSETNAGKGLINTIDRKKHDWVCPFVGEKTTQYCINKWYPGGDNTTAPYVECDPHSQHNFCYDSACRRGIGAMANTKTEKTRPQGRKGPTVRQIARPSLQNCKAELRTPSEGGDGSFWLRTTQHLKAGKELFLDYGSSYLLQDNHSTTRRQKIPDAMARPPCTPLRIRTRGPSAR